MSTKPTTKKPTATKKVVLRKDSSLAVYSTKERKYVPVEFDDEIKARLALLWAPKPALTHTVGAVNRVVNAREEPLPELPAALNRYFFINGEIQKVLNRIDVCVCKLTGAEHKDREVHSGIYYDKSIESLHGMNQFNGGNLEELDRLAVRLEEIV